MNRCRNAKGWISATVGLSAMKMGLSTMVFVLVSSRMVIGVGCRSRREWFTTIGFGFGFRLSRMVIGDGLGVIGDILGFYRRRFGSEA